MTVGNGVKEGDPRHLKLGGHVGFDSLPDQLVNKSVQNGFSFNILSIGETGIGKSTLSDSLFNTTFDSAPETHKEPGVRLKAHTYELQVKLVLILSEMFPLLTCIIAKKKGKDNLWRINMNIF